MDSRANLFESQNFREKESQINMADKTDIKVKAKPAIKQWDNPIEFLMTCIGYAVGIGGVIRFPYLCFQNGGCAFVIAFLIMLFIFGVPLFFLELTISQYSKCGADKVWKVIPLLKGLGICSIVINTYFCIYFNVLISYSVIYLIQSFYPKLPWIRCDNWWNDPITCKAATSKEIVNASIAAVGNVTGLLSSNLTNATHAVFEPASKQYFYNYVLEISNGVDELNGLNFKVVGALAICWIMAFLSLIKGIASLGKVSYFTAIFPYVMITVLIIRGCTLEGAMKGLNFYILTVDMNYLLNLKTWILASSQALFCLGIAQGSLLTLGKHNSFNYNHQKATCFIAVLDGFTGIYAGFAIFSVIGFMAHTTGQDVSDLELNGLGLSFIVYPEALSLMPFPWIWCIFFFMMMITIGFGSLLSMTECALDTFTSIAGISSKHTIKLRFGTCLFFFLSGLIMTTKGGYYILNMIDHYTCTVPIIVLAALEAVGLGWFYGTKRLDENMRLMLNTNLNLYWKICFKVLTPTVALVMFFITMISKNEVTFDGYEYPKWIHYLGQFIVATCLSPLFIFAFRSLYKAGVLDVIYELTQPGENWKPAYDNQTQFNDDSSDNSSNRSSISSVKDKKKVPLNRDDYTSVKLQKITESNAQIMFTNNSDEDEEEED